MGWSRPTTALPLSGAFECRPWPARINRPRRARALSLRTQIFGRMKKRLFWEILRLAAWQAGCAHPRKGPMSIKETALRGNAGSLQDIKERGYGRHAERHSLFDIRRHRGLNAASEPTSARPQCACEKMKVYRLPKARGRGLDSVGA